MGYKHFRNGVIRSVNIILNIFESEETKEYCKQEILFAWTNLKKSNDIGYERFVEDFHVFNPENLIFDENKRIELILNEEIKRLEENIKME